MTGGVYTIEYFMPDSVKVYSSEKALEKIDEIREIISRNPSIVIIYIYNDKAKRDMVINSMKAVQSQVRT